MRISDWSSVVCSSDLFDRTVVMRDYDGGRFRRLAAGGPACVVETRAIDEFHVCVGLPEIFDLFLDFDILAFPEFFDVREIVAIGREEVADEAIVELDREIGRAHV